MTGTDGLPKWLSRKQCKKLLGPAFTQKKPALASLSDVLSADALFDTASSENAKAIEIKIFVVVCIIFPLFTVVATEKTVTPPSRVQSWR